MSSRLLKSVSTVGCMTLLSRISGLVRDVIFANILGDKAAADIFFVAFRIPNFFRRMFGEGAFSMAFVPVFTEYRETRKEHETNSFLQLMLGRFGLILLVVTILGVVFAPLLVTALATGFQSDPDKYALTVQATRITFPYVFFISLVAMSAAMLNTCGRFAAPAATPVLLNICLIGAALLLVPHFSQSPIALSVGVLIAGAIQLVFQIPFLRMQKLSIRPRLIKRSGDEAGFAGVKEVFRLTIPALFGVSVAQVNMIVNMVLASFLVTGSISWLYYSDRLMEFPLGVFAIALSTVLLPDLSRMSAKNAFDEFSGTINWAIRWVYLVCMPATVGLIVLAYPMVATIYFHGDFTINGVKMTSASLVAYSPGLTALAMVKVLAAGFFARKNTKTPVKVAAMAMIVNIVFCFTLVGSMQHVGLALATSLSAFFNAILLFVLLRKQNILGRHSGNGLFIVKVILSAVIMGVVLQWTMGDPQSWLEVSVWQRISKLFILVVLGGLVYFASLLAVGIRPRNMLLKATL